MRIAITGSIATDHLMTFPGRFVEQFIPEKMDRVSLSFLVDALEIRRGGVAANIAFGLGVLGLSPLLIGAVGEDFAPYRAWLTGHGVDCGGVRESTTQHTARFVCTTDVDGQPDRLVLPRGDERGRRHRAGPPRRAGRRPGPGADRRQRPRGMLDHTQECKDLGIPFAADLSQQLPRLDSDGVRALVDGAAYLFCNEYEEALIERKSSWSGPDILDRVGVRVTTLGPAGAKIEQAGAEPVFVAAVPEVRKVDPTGTGDAFRSGFLAAVAWGLPLERAAQLGNLLAVHVLETVGTQEYELKPGALAERLGAVYGEDAAAEIAAHYSCGRPRAAPAPLRSFRNEPRARPAPSGTPEGTARVRAVPSVMLSPLVRAARAHPGCNSWASRRRSRRRSP